jgi:putative transposase
MMAFEQPELSPRELATRFTDTNSYYVSESSVYRLLKAHDLIGSPAFIVIKAADEFRDKTTAPNQLWQTDFTYLKIIGWGWYYLSKPSSMTTRVTSSPGSCARRCVPTTSPIHLSWRWWPQAATAPRSCTNHDCSATMDRVHLERSCGMAKAPWHRACSRRPVPSADPGQDRALAPDAQEPHSANYYLPGDLEAQIARFVEHHNHRRYHESLQNLTPGRCQTILLERERIKSDTIKLRRLQHQLKAA